MPDTVDRLIDALDKNAKALDASTEARRRAFDAEGRRLPGTPGLLDAPSRQRSAADALGGARPGTTLSGPGRVGYDLLPPGAAAPPGRPGLAPRDFGASALPVLAPGEMPARTVPARPPTALPVGPAPEALPVLSGNEWAQRQGRERRAAERAAGTYGAPIPVMPEGFDVQATPAKNVTPLPMARKATAADMMEDHLRAMREMQEAALPQAELYDPKKEAREKRAKAADSLAKDATKGRGKLTETAVGMATGQGGGLGALGEMAGTAMGGPIGGMIGKAVAEKVPEALAAPAKLASDSLKLFGDSLNGLKSQLGPVQVGFDLMGKSIEGLKGLLGPSKEMWGPMLDAMAGIPKQAASILTTLTQFAGLHNSGITERMKLASDDFMGVIGRSVAPAIELLTPTIRLMGDALATILPSQQQVAELTKGLAGVLGDMRTAGDELAPTLRYLRDVFIEVARGPMQDFTYMLKGMAQSLVVAAKVMQGLGLVSGPRKLDSSLGAAGQPAKFQGYTDYSREVYQKAFSIGARGTADPQLTAAQSTALATTQAAAILGRIEPWIEAIKGAVALAGHAADQVERVTSNPLGALFGQAGGGGAKMYDAMNEFGARARAGEDPRKLMEEARARGLM